MMITSNPLVYAPGAILKVRQTIQMMITSNAFVCTRSTVQAVKFARSVLSGQLVFPGDLLPPTRIILFSSLNYFRSSPVKHLGGLLNIFCNFTHWMGEGRGGGALVPKGGILVVFYKLSSNTLNIHFAKAYSRGILIGFTVIICFQLRKIRIPIVSDTECDRFLNWLRILWNQDWNGDLLSFYLD